MEKGLGVLVDKLNLSEQCAAAAESQQHAGLLCKGITETENSLSHFTQHLSPEILCSVLVPAIKKQCGQAGKGPVKGHN